MKIVIAGKNGQHISLEVNPTDTILSAKKRLKQEKATWKFDTEVLTDDKTFRDFDFEEGDIITSTLKVYGGII